MGDIDRVLASYQFIESFAPSIGLAANAEKCELWWPSASAQSLSGFPAEIKRVRNDGVQLLGSPIGCENFIRSALRDTVDSLHRLHSRLLRPTTPKWSSVCFKPAWGSASASDLPTGHCRRVSSLFDDLLRDTLTRNVDAGTLSDSSWLQASLPISRGGVGIILSCADIALPAYVGSCLQSLKLTAALVEPSGLEYTSTFLAARLRESTTSLPPLEKLLQEGHLRRKLSRAVWSHRATSVASPDDVRSVARLGGLRMPHAADFLQVRTSSGCGPPSCIRSSFSVT